MSDFQVKVGGDFSEVLRGFQQLPQEASKAGQGIGKGLDDGIKQYSEKSLAALNAELNRLQQRQIKVAVDSSAFEKAGVKIREVQSLITAVEKQRLLIGVDDRSITAVQVKLADLQNKQTKVSVDSQEFIDLQRQINATEKELQEISQRKVLIDADANSFLAVTAKLRNELNSLQERQLKVDVDSQEFIALGREIDRIEGELSALERKRTAVTIDASSVQALQTKLTDLQTRQTKVSVDSQGFVDLQRQIDTVQRDLQDVDSKRITIDADGSSLIALTTRFKAELQALEQKRVKVDVDSQEFVDLSRQIDQVEGELSALERRKLLINADPSSIIALRSRLGELQNQLDRTQIGSQRFKELQRAVKDTELEIANASQSTRKLSDILNANISGGIFGQLAGLASAGAVVGFLKSSVDAAVQLETITRKLSNTLGAQGAAGALAFTRQLSDELGLSFNTLSNTFGGFTAAATAAGVPMQQQKDLFAAVSKSAQQLGLSNDELSGSLLALQQVASKGTVQMEELRGQLGERLPIAFGATAKGLGITQQELSKLVESGGLSAERFFEGLTKGLNELNSDDGGIPTAAQNFQKLQNAWTDLQANFGTSLLPSITEATRALAGALEGLRIDVAARDLRESFGVTAQEAVGLVGVMEMVQKQFGLTSQQAKNLLSDAIANTGASRDWFGELNLGGKQFEQVQLSLIDLAKQYRDANPDAAARIREEAIEAQKVEQQRKLTLALEQQRVTAARELAKVMAEGEIQNLQNRITLGQQLVGLSQALADREQSRFAVVKAGLEFELAGAEKRGASEVQIGAIKKQIQELDRQALQARFQALQQEQQLQIKMLELSQQKARLEADLSVQEQRAEILKAQVELQKAQASGSQAEIAAASAQVELQQAILGIKTQQQNTLKQTQPIEAAILGLQQETAINGERAKAAQMGYRFEANGSLVAINALAGAADRVGVVTANSVTEQARLTSVAQQTGLAIERAADGSFVLGRSQQDVTRATEALNRQLDGSATAAGKTADAAGGIGDAVSDASSPAGDIASAFTSTSGTAPKAAQGARDFAGWLSGAKTFGQQIANLPLVNQMGEVANRTQSAANAAKVFYDWLERASRLPGSRWTGGPVDAGEQYRVNELGQEALLAGGRLSLINAAPNSLWRAPANGTVIPAGITSRLQEQGALPGRAGAALPMGGGGSNAALAVEVGKLRQEVGELARKQWNVNISTKTGPTGSQVLKQMLR